MEATGEWDASVSARLLLTGVKVLTTLRYRFDMMNKRVYKNYVDLTNIIMRVSDGSPAGKEHAVLVNSHLDSTLPSPGECFNYLTRKFSAISIL